MPAAAASAGAAAASAVILSGAFATGFRAGAHGGLNMGWGWLILLFMLFVMGLVGWWFIHGYYLSHKAEVPGFWQKLIEAFDGSMTKVVAHFVALLASASVATPEVLNLVGGAQGAAVITRFWPEYAGAILLLISVAIIFARNRSLR